jgi:hypothetical protein
MSILSLNNRFIVEAYFTDRSLKAKETNGFAMIQQKVSLKGLRLLVPARLDKPLSSTANGGPLSETIIPAGSIVYIREELLHTQPWAQKIFESEAVEGKFMIVDMTNIEFVQLA